MSALARAANVSAQLRKAGFAVIRNVNRQGVRVSQVGDDVRIRISYYVEPQLSELTKEIVTALEQHGYTVRTSHLCPTPTLWVSR